MHALYTAKTEARITKTLTATGRVIPPTQHGQERFKQSLNVFGVIVVAVLDQDLQHTKDLHRVAENTHIRDTRSILQLI